MEIVSAATGEATKSAIVHVEREFGYLIHFKRSTKILKERIQQLTATKSDVQARIDAAVRNGESILETVEEWTKRADLVLGEATELSDEASVINSWFRGWCCGRFSLGRKAQKTIDVIQGLCAEGSGFGANVSYRKPTQSLKMVGAEDFNAFASRASTAEEIRKALLDDAINMVGVHGMPGVGKTTLIKAITKQVKEEQLFQEVVLVIVSQNPSLKTLQEDIAEGLDFSLVGDNVLRRAQQLSERLNQDAKTTLVILDDVWDRIELSEVGIPYKNHGNCCKVLFTTRDQGVCDRMEANTKIEVELLSQEDSWVLFRQKSGTVADLSVARELLNECKCLPLAIITLGLALRNKNENVCVDALQQLQKSIFEGMSPVDSSIKLSYNFLTNESKVCFLFCCLFPEDHRMELDTLLSYVMGEKLLKDVDTYEEARGRLYSILDKLVSSGLLLRDEDEVITMHDVVRDTAISIATKEEKYIVKAGRNLSDWPDMELGSCKRLSMMYNNIQCLPSIPIKAPHLQALFLNDNDNLKELPLDVFVEMKSLMTLDLSRTAIQSFPPSLSFLQNLRTLLLNETDLTNLSPIEKLEKLEELSLRENRKIINEFREEMGNLSNLKVLDLTNTFFSNSITPNLISKLHRLETFHLLHSYVYTPKPNFEETKFFCEVGSLNRLTSLQLQIHNPQLYHIEIPGSSWVNLTRFHIEVNPGSSEIGVKSRFENVLDLYKGISRSLWLSGIRGNEVANWVLVLLGKTYFLHLEERPYLKSFTEVGASKEMNHNLKFLSLSRCRQIECLINNTESNYEYEFSHLEGLEISDCQNLLYVLQPEEAESSELSNIRRISEPLVLPIFPNLKRVEMSHIPKIRYVFTMRVVRNLLHLEDLDIDECSKMEVLFKYEDGEDIKSDQVFKDTAILPRLKNLTMRRADKLKTFTNKNLVMELPSLEHLTVFNCGMFERLPFGTTSVPNLKSFQMLNILKIRYVFTMRVARNLLMLEDLEIRNCWEMEVLFKYGDGEDVKCDEEFKDTAILPRLKKLKIWGAPKLKSFANRNLVMELPALELLEVYYCGSLERLPFGTTTVPNLKTCKMEHEHFDRLEWEDENVMAHLQAILSS